MLNCKASLDSIHEGGIRHDFSMRSILIYLAGTQVWYFGYCRTQEQSHGFEFHVDEDAIRHRVRTLSAFNLKRTTVYMHS